VAILSIGLSLLQAKTDLFIANVFIYDEMTGSIWEREDGGG